MAKHIDPAVKQAVLADIKNGMRVTEAARKHGTTDATIYAWLKVQADNTGTSSLEMAKLRRENEELKEIVALFALDKRRAEKNTKRS
jgi:transposase-like protein